MPAASIAVRTAESSSGAEVTWKTVPSGSTSSAPPSAATSRSSSSSTPSAGTTTTPRRSNCHATAPVAPRLPPLFANMWRTSAAVRFLLSVSASTITATPSGPYPSYTIVSNASASASAPEPLEIARSMLSRGIEYDFAFSIAFCSARLFAGSPPPSFAATMIAFESFEKSCPRFASAAPFLCLIDDHLLCPDNLCLPDGFQEQFMQPRVVGQLRVERGDEESSLAREHRAAVDLSKHLHARPDVLDPRRTDEDGPHRLVEPDDRQVGLERRDLPPECVAPHRDVDEAEMVAIEHDHPRACADHRPLETTDPLVEPVELHQPRERGRLAARDHEPVEPVELIGLPNLDDVGAETAQHLPVLAKVSLHGQNADLERFHASMVSP